MINSGTRRRSPGWNSISGVSFFLRNRAVKFPPRPHQTNRSPPPPLVKADHRHEASAGAQGSGVPRQLKSFLLVTLENRREAYATFRPCISDDWSVSVLIRGGNDTPWMEWWVLCHHHGTCRHCERTWQLTIVVLTFAAWSPAQICRTAPCNT